MSVYIDIIFLVNFTITFLFLYFSTLIVKLYRPVKIYRLLLSSFTTSFIYILFIYFEIVLWTINFLTMELLLCLSIFIAFYPINKKLFLKFFYIIHIITFSFGGILIGLINLFNNNLLGFITSKNYLSVKIFLSSLCIFYIVLKVIHIKLNEHKKSSKIVCEVEMKAFEKVYNIAGLYDSGNLLMYNNKPVCIVDLTVIENSLPKDLRDKILYEENVYEIIYNFKEYLFFPIQFKTVGTKKNILLGFTCEYVKINKKKYDNVYIGITKNLDNNKFIINSSMID